MEKKDNFKSKITDLKTTCFSLLPFVILFIVSIVYFSISSQADTVAVVILSIPLLVLIKVFFNLIKNILILRKLQYEVELFDKFVNKFKGIKEKEIEISNRELIDKFKAVGINLESD